MHMVYPISAVNLPHYIICSNPVYSWPDQWDIGLLSLPCRVVNFACWVLALSCSEMSASRSFCISIAEDAGILKLFLIKAISFPWCFETPTAVDGLLFGVILLVTFCSYRRFSAWVLYLCKYFLLWCSFPACVGTGGGWHAIEDQIKFSIWDDVVFIPLQPDFLPHPPNLLE